MRGGSYRGRASCAHGASGLGKAGAFVLLVLGMLSSRPPPQVRR